ncbi:MAG TPA: discoidin domain-containing protein [Verrucomicrobiae bacterium]
MTWNEESGVMWHTPWADVMLDRAWRQRGPVLRFLNSGAEILLERPSIDHTAPGVMKLGYRVTGPDGTTLQVTRILRIERTGADCALAERFELRPGAPIAQDLEIARPFTITTQNRGGAAGVNAGCVLPLKNGWARSRSLSLEQTLAEYKLGNWISGRETPELALPVVQIDENQHWRAAVCSDPRFSALFTLAAGPDQVTGEIRYRYAGSKVPVSGLETRQFGFWVREAPRPTEPFGQSLDAFFRLMLPDVPPGPQWLHQIYMVGYDFLSDDGRGWEEDISRLAGWLKKRERRHTALCLHGWYDALGSYSFDETKGRLRDRWTAMARTRKVDFTPAELRRRLRVARAQGFRVLLYFGDGLAADSGVPDYHSDWAYLDGQGKKVSGWQGPDTFGPTYLMNPAHPEVRKRFLDYLDALLAAVGRDVDGFVWDETFHARAGQIAAAPLPAYCDRAMMDLVKELTARVRAFDSRKVFLASDCVGIAPGIPGYAMVASGLYQDTHCNPERWPDALFPNWRNTYWSCNWGPASHFHWTRFGVEEFGAPVAISNGWGDDHGPHEWTAAELEDCLKLFRQRLAKGPAHVRYLSEDPTALLQRQGPDSSPAPGDPVPPPGPDEVNWALAAEGSHARASSEHASQDRRYPAGGAIDGLRGNEGWGHGHGWASASGAALPQWLEIEFPQPRSISRFLITTYQAPGESARRWGVQEYSIEVWDHAAEEWKAVVHENQGRILFTRVHALLQPVTTRKFRVVVTRVAPSAGGVARLLQVEAWGLRQ